MRWGAGAGASRLISGNMEPHRQLEARLAEFKGYEAALLFGSGYLANTGAIAALAGARRGRLLRRAQPRQHRRRLPPLPGRDLRLPPRRPRAPRLGPARGGRARRADRHRRRLLDGRRRRAAAGAAGAGAPPRLPADGRRGPRDRRDRPRRARLGRRRRPQRRGRRRRRHARQGARLLRRLRLRQRARRRLPASTRPAPSSSRPPRRRPRSPPPRRRWSCSQPSPSGSSGCRPTRAPCARPSRAEGLDGRPLADPDRAGRGRRRGDDDGALRARARARRLRPGDPPADRPRGLLAPALHGDGDPPRRRAASAPRSWSAAPPASSASLAPPGASPPDGAVSARRGLRHRHRHRGRQDRRRRRHRPAPWPAKASAVAVFKPAVTGLDEPGESRPRAAAPRRPARGQSDEEIAPYRYGPPASPHLAAALAGEEIEPERLLRRRAGRGRGRRRVSARASAACSSARRRAAYLVRDLAADLGYPLVIAAAPGLGTINHTLLTIEAARAAGLEVAAVVLTPWPERAERDRALQPRDDRRARRGRGPDPAPARPRRPGGPGRHRLLVGASTR